MRKTEPLASSGGGHRAFEGAYPGLFDFKGIHAKTCGRDGVATEIRFPYFTHAL